MPKSSSAAHHRSTVMVFLASFILLAGCSEQNTASNSESGRDGIVGGRLQVGQILGDAKNNNSAGLQADQFKRADRPRNFSFPQDHGPHPNFQSEWWYLTSVLSDVAGREYGTQFTLFRQALSAGGETSDNPWRSNQVYLGHFAITDVDKQSHEHAQRFSRGHLLAAGVSLDPGFSAFIEDWKFSAVDNCDQTLGSCWQLNAQDHMANTAKPSAARLNLFAEAVQAQVGEAAEMPIGLILQGDAGLSHKGPEQASYYYSMPRLRTQGSLVIDGVERSVNGWTWLDREWSTSVLGQHLQGWDWFSLQLEDGASLMVFQLRRKDGQQDPYNHGVLVQKGIQNDLSAAHYRLTPHKYWLDSEGVAWPITWTLAFDDLAPVYGGRQFEITAMVDDQLMDVGIVYWEGLVAIREDGQSIGRGYMELTGYQ